jgi:hypothetical protein
MRIIKYTIIGLCCLTLSAEISAEIKGDAEAIELANKMITSIGGKELWSEIRTLYIVEKSRSPKGDGIIGEFWRDLQQPREWYTLKNRSGLEVKFWWDHRGVWQFINGERNQKLPETLHDEVKSYWQGEIYVMYHRLASEDSSIRLEKNSDNSFTAFDEKIKRRLGTFWINADGQMYRWRHDDGTEYIYGPHKKFGDISFPDWGTQIDGSWSFYYVEVRWSKSEPPVSFDPPS